MVFVFELRPVRSFHGEEPISQHLTVVIATLNERETLPHLIAALQRVLPQAHLLVVDDNSPDGTGDWVADQARECETIQLHRRPHPEGLGRAALEGIALALERTACHWVATMDADLSHDPADLAAMYAKCLGEWSDYDVVIGSRYVAGGAIVDWPWRRRCASKAVNAFARATLGLKPRDNTGALRIYRSNKLRDSNITSRIVSPGHVYLEEILWRLQQAESRIVEHPITFRDRQAGNSSLTASGVASNLRQLMRLAGMRLRSR